ncbi:NAD-dependent epimerase/dehydratase family protein [Enterobacter sp. Ap-1006]|uniref:NAD-dependent epimerase/dehydratase family protein n=1 Tax=Enterobacter sp. Ap-1006 TaxID=2608345 RepID=UPI00141E3930|nr:NAD-dependent epimerase/dehydratase family protein [Enterobacter sp. Ap-1006]NIF46261.1 NAD-dependent epimerase/dehydratase family protein [Enterobacter sp. Ap-1006]
MADTVLVTGGSGFIARWIIIRLLQSGFRVRATLRKIEDAAEIKASLAPIIRDLTDLSFVVAELTRDEGWDEVMQGCRYVQHVASPLRIDGKSTHHEMLQAAQEGTLRILDAAIKAGVERVVFTSAAATATPPMESAASSLSDESVWFDPGERQVDIYRLSKRRAERSAWDYLAQEGKTSLLTTILPGAVFGPVLTRKNLGSVQVIDRLLNGKMPATPRLGFEIVDVRDLARLHVEAMTHDAAAGERFLAVGEFKWLHDIALLLRTLPGVKPEKISLRVMPDTIYRLLSLFQPTLKAMRTRLGKKHLHTSRKANMLFGWEPRSTRETLADCVHSLLVTKGAEK